MSESTVGFSLSLIPEEQRGKLTETQVEALNLNDRIYDVHKAFNERVDLATTVQELQDLVREYAGTNGEFNTGHFSDLLDEMDEIGTCPEGFVLVSTFKGQQRISYNHFSKKFDQLQLLENPGWN